MIICNWRHIGKITFHFNKHKNVISRFFSLAVWPNLWQFQLNVVIINFAERMKVLSYFFSYVIIYIIFSSISRSKCAVRDELRKVKFMRDVSKNVCSVWRCRKNSHDEMSKKRVSLSLGNDKKQTFHKFQAFKMLRDTFTNYYQRERVRKILFIILTATLCEKKLFYTLKQLKFQDRRIFLCCLICSSIFRMSHGFDGGEMGVEKRLFCVVSSNFFLHSSKK